MTEKRSLAIDSANDAGIYIHTALRKICESDATSLLYNVVHLCDKGWLSYLDILWPMLQEDPQPGTLKRAAKELPWGDTERTALRLTFEYCDDDDLERMTAWLWKTSDDD